MRTFLLLFLLFITLPVFSQNYRTVVTNQEVYFDFKDVDLDLSPSRVILTDSFQIINLDTIIYHQFNQEFEVHYLYNDTINNYSYCHFPVDTGFMGTEVILRSNGDDIFFNRFQDSIFIQTQANLNESWIFYQNTNGYFEATISSIGQASFLGITDSVKNITLQAKDNLGNNISSPYDSLNIKISQYHGLIEGFNFFRFPYGVTTELSFSTYKKIKLLGIPSVNKGIEDLTAFDVYNFDVGDEVQWETVQYVSQNVVCDDYEYEIMKVNGKQFSSNGDSVYYDVHLQHYILDCTEDFPPISSTTVFDTIYIGDTLLGYDVSIDNHINTMTLHRDSDSTLWIQSEDGNRKVTLNVREPNWNASGCFPPLISPFTSSSVIYHKGLGTTYWVGGWYPRKKKIIYYKKNGLEWGIPVNIDSLSTVSTSTILENTLNIKVFPNPTSDILNFEFDESIDGGEIRIYSSIGQLMGSQIINDTDMQFDVMNWNCGVYYYGIYVEGRLMKQGQILVRE